MGFRGDIVHLAANPHTGVAKSLRILAAAQARAGSRVHLRVLPYRGQRPPDWFSGLDLRILSSPVLPGTLAIAWAALSRNVTRDLMREFGGDSELIVHIHDPSLAGAVVSHALRERAAIVVTLHGTSILAQLRERALRRLIHSHWFSRACERADVITSVDGAAPSAIATFFSQQAPAFVRIPNAVEAAPTRRSTATGCVRLAQIGTVDPNKGWQLTASAVDLCRQRGVPASLTIAGPGPESDSARTWCSHRAYAKYLPWVDDVPNTLLPHVDVLVVASQYEGLPMVVLEALASGIPIIATRAGGIPEVVRDGVEGILVDRNPRAIAQAITLLERDRALLARMSANAVARWSAHYTPAAVADAHFAAYDEALLRFHARRGARK